MLAPVIIFKADIRERSGQCHKRECGAILLIIWRGPAVVRAGQHDPRPEGRRLLPDRGE
jgi:hypothetical protein